MAGTTKKKGVDVDLNRDPEQPQLDEYIHSNMDQRETGLGDRGLQQQQRDQMNRDDDRMDEGQSLDDVDDLDLDEDDRHI